MGWQQGSDGGTGEGPDRDPGLPFGGACGPEPGGPARDPRLAVFAAYGEQDGALPPGPVPCGLLAMVADEVSGPERRCPGATGNERVGIVRAWAAIESWAAAAKLGAVREMIRHDGAPSPGSDHGDLPETWSPSLRHELAAALACSVQSAETTVWLAWELQARLPGTAARLEDGTLTQPKARAIAETFQGLTDADAARAEAMIADLLAGKTYAQVLRLAEQAALTVDPALAERRRERAQQNARVSFFREQAGTAALSGRDLPPDETLAAMAAVNARAEEYKESGAFGDAPMDALRARAYLDLINGVPAAGRVASAEPQDDDGAAEARPANRTRPDPGARPNGDDTGNSDEGARVDPATAEPDARRPGSGAQADPGQCPCSDCDGSCCPCTECDGSCLAGDELDLDDEPGPDGHPGDGGPGTNDPDPDGPGGPGGPDPGGSGGPGPGAGVGKPAGRRPPDLTVPLATLLGLAQRPGDIHGFGLLDPRLARELASAAAASPRTEICVTVTSPEGYAIGHGCARSTRAPRQAAPPPPAATPAPAPAALPARLNLTIPATALPGLAKPPGHTSPWAFTPRGRPGTTGPPPAGPGTREGPGTSDYFGAWTLLIPGGRTFTVRLEPVPTFSCDHRYESRGYQPGDRLRHLVQIRDGTCTFPPCNRHARESDFEHALPYDQGGRTCTCNAGARSRACHRVKQSPGWEVTQPRPGWHRWQTPAGRIYVQAPKRYPY